MHLSNNFLFLLKSRGAFFNCIDKILAFFDPLPPYVDIFYIFGQISITYLLTYLALST